MPTFSIRKFATRTIHCVPVHIRARVYPIANASTRHDGLEIMFFEDECMHPVAMPSTSVGLAAHGFTGLLDTLIGIFQLSERLKYLRHY